MHMLSLTFAVIFLALAVTAVILRKAYDVVPAHELKRQAASGNDLARQLYRVVGYGLSLRVLLWAVLLITSAAGFVLLARVLPGWASIITVAITLWLAFSWLPSTRLTGPGTRLAKALSPVLGRILHYIDPVLRGTVAPFVRRYRPRHSGLYELQDLLNLLELQSSQPDSRITTEEISLIRQVLQFGDQKVRDVFRPRSKVKAIALTDAIGPVLLDELHASGQSSFPVKKTARSKEIVACLHLGDVGIHSTGEVQDYVSPGVVYIHESDSLADALHVFFQTKRQLAVVVNSFEEYVGVLTLEDILQTLLGHPAANEMLGSHDDLVSVAARHGAKTDTESDETVVE